MAAFALGKLHGWTWHDSHFVCAHTFGQAGRCALLLLRRSSLRALLSYWSNALLEVHTPLNWMLCEVTFSRLPKHVGSEIVSDADAIAVTRTVAVSALCFCYLEGSHAAPPIVCLRQKQPDCKKGELLADAQISRPPTTPLFAASGP
jgi:hypothetical protein